MLEIRFEDRVITIFDGHGHAARRRFAEAFRVGFLGALRIGLADAAAVSPLPFAPGSPLPPFLNHDGRSVLSFAT